MEVETNMKIKLLIVFLALCCFGATVSAQDTGTPDEVIVTFTHMPDVAAGDSSVVIEVYFATDQTINAVGYGMTWDFDGFVMESVVFTPAFITAFNVQIKWANSNLDSTNFKRQFQCTGFTFDVNYWTAPGLAATFTGHVTRWTEGDVITITPHSFVPPGFVPVGGDEYTPVWGGDATLADVKVLDLGNLPTKFDLGQNYPNPFNPSTTIGFTVPVGSTESKHVILKIYNLRGQLVSTLVDDNRESGNYLVRWDGKTGTGGEVGSGIYLYRLSVGDHTAVRKMVLLK